MLVVVRLGPRRRAQTFVEPDLQFRTLPIAPPIAPPFTLRPTLRATLYPYPSPYPLPYPSPYPSPLTPAGQINYAEFCRCLTADDILSMKQTLSAIDPSTAVKVPIYAS